MALGRPTEYREEFVELGFKYALSGHTDGEIAELLGISESSLYEYKNRYPDFAQAIKRGKAPADAEVTHSLFDNATKQNNVTAQIFWLKNRQPDRWRERAEPNKIELELSFQRDPARFARVIEQAEEEPARAKIVALLAGHPPDIQEHLRLVLQSVPEDEIETVYNQAIGTILAASGRGQGEQALNTLLDRQQIDVKEMGSGYMANQDDEPEEERASLQDAVQKVEAHNQRVRARKK